MSVLVHGFPPEFLDRLHGMLSEPGSTARVVHTPDGGWDAVPMVPYHGRLGDGRSWLDAPEQGDDR